LGLQRGIDLIQVYVVAPTLAERTGLRALIESNERAVVFAEATGLPEVELLPREIDILLISTAAPQRSDLERICGSTDPSPAVLILTDDQEAVRLVAEICTGAWGVLNVDCTEEELITTIEGLDRGLVVAEPQFITQIGRVFSGEMFDREEMSESLTERELDVLQLLANGLANKQIALELDISEHTVKFHLSSIYAKLSAVNRAEAVRLGVRYGLITV
jgi:DNA-binding NarL/FixJ family response regulator